MQSSLAPGELRHSLRILLFPFIPTVSRFLHALPLVRLFLYSVIHHKIPAERFSPSCPLPYEPRFIKVTFRSLIIVSERSLVNFTENTVPALCDVKFADPDQHAFLSSVLWDDPVFISRIHSEGNQSGGYVPQRWQNNPYRRW